MSPDRTNGHAEGVGDLFVAALLLMIKDEDGSLDVAETLEVLFDGLLELALLQLLLGVAVGVGETVLPGGDIIGEGDVEVAVAAAALPLVLGDVDGNAVEIGRNERVSTKAGQGAVEAEKDVLGEIVEMFAAAGEAQQGAKDHLLMVAYHLLEGEISRQAGLDHSLRLKFHSSQ